MPPPATRGFTQSSADAGAAPAVGPMLTLMSDFGLQDPYVGIMKSRILLRAAHVSVVDLTHQISPFEPEEAGYWLHCCYGQFPAGTVHLAVVDPGVGSERSILVLRAAAQLFVAPDNGLLGLIVQTHPEAVAYQVQTPALALLGLSLSSATFHGRDVMAPLAAELACGRVRPEQLGPVYRPALGRLRPPLQRADGSLCGQVALIDHFGNALTTVPAAVLAERPPVQLSAKEPPLRWVHTYAEARPGECVALINSSSMLELAMREGNLALQWNIRPGQEVYIGPQAIGHRP